jgi:Ser/Thr protein kinase RdoA (MazF antagonist)
MNNIKQVLTHWNLSDVIATPIESHSQTTWDVDGKYVLKCFRNSDDFSRGTQFSELLIPFKIPVAAFVPTKNGQLTSPDGLYCLMTKLLGKHADFYKEPALAIEMGRGLAELHIALADIESKVSCYDSNLLDDWQTRFKPSLNDVSDSIIHNVDARFTEVFPKLPRQLIHRDVHEYNVLFDDGRLTGWLDFDIGERNVRIFDIAYLLSGLLIGSTDNPEKIKQWHTIYNNLMHGYCEINPLSNYECDALPILMIMIEFLFVWFWDGQNNTEQRKVARELVIWLYEKFVG